MRTMGINHVALVARDMAEAAEQRRPFLTVS